MNIEMYRIFFEIQKKHWWFVTKKSIVIDTIHRYFHTKADVKVLDIGCGSGLMLSALERIGQTYGMDMSDEAISFSKELFSGRVEKGFLPNQVPFDKDFFNLITALDVIEHIDEDVEALKAIRALLVADGKAVITVPACMWLWSNFDEMNEHKRRYTLAELKQKLELAGFSIEKISYYNTILFPVVFVVRMLNNLLGRNGSSDMDMPNKPLNFTLEKIFGFEKYLLRFINLPFGVSVIAVVKK